MRSTSTRTWRRRLRRRLRKYGGSGSVALAALAVVAVVAVGAAVTRHTGAAADQGTAPAAVPTFAYKHRPLVVEIGDSHMGGSPQKLADMLGKAMGWEYVDRGVGGSGFISKGNNGEAPFADRLPKATDPKPDVIFVEGGTNDVKYGAPAEKQAVTAFLTQAKQVAPKARIVLIAPFFTGDAGAPGRAMSQAFADAVAQFPGVDRIDPAGWVPGTFGTITGTGANLKADPIHLNQAGRDLVVPLMVKALTRLGYNQPVAG